MAIDERDHVVLVVLPAGTGAEGRARVSVVSSLRAAGAGHGELCASGATVHCPFCDWPATLRTLQFSVSVKGKATPIWSGSAPSVSSGEWKALFGCDTRVKPFDSTRTGRKRPASPKLMSNAPGARTRDSAGVAGQWDTPSGLGLAVLRAAASPLSEGSATATMAEALEEIAAEHHRLPTAPPPSYASLYDSFESLGEGKPDLARKLQRHLLFHMTPRHVFADAARGAPAQWERTLDRDDHGQTFIADPPSGEGKRFKFGLPSLSMDDAGYEVTLRNGGAGPVVVVSEAPIDDKGSPIQILAGADRPVFRWNGSSWKTFAENDLDFHAALSAVAQFPELQRRLGLIFDVDLPLTLTELEAHPQRQIRVDVRGAMDVVSPWTAYALNADKRIFTAASAKNSLCQIVGGMLKRDAQHAVFEFDVDAAALQLPPIAQKLYELKQAGQRDELDADAAHELAPRLRDAGMTLHDNATAARVGEQMARAVRLLANIESAGVWPDEEALYIQDLLQGFRVDIAATGSGSTVWQSLHQRRVSCWIGGASRDVTASPTIQFSDEGWIETGAQQSGPEDIYKVASTLARWEGWSLSVPRPGKALADDSTVVATASYPAAGGLALRVACKGVRRSLPRRRIGQKYWMRLRAVDLAGNSVPVESEADPASLFQVVGTDGNEIPLGRVEAVAPPLLAPKQAVFPPSTNVLLAIRTSDERPAKTAEWLILPPKVSQNFAELHGVFDRFAHSEEGARKLWQRLRELQGEPPRWIERRGDAISRGYDEQWFEEHTHNEVLKLPYHPDPLARACVIEGLPSSTGMAALEFSREKRTPIGAHDVRALVLRLKSGDIERSSVCESELEVELPLGETRTLWLRSGIDAADARCFSLLNMEARSVAVLSQRAVESGVPSVTPRQMVTLVHATQRPVCPEGHKRPKWATINFERLSGSTTADLSGRLHLHVPSTGKVSVELSWADIVDDPALPDWVSVTQRIDAFEYTVGSSDVSPVPVFGTCRLIDTKHHTVRVSGPAWTRYADHFPDLARGAGKELLTLPIEPVECNVLASTPPAKPEPYYILPLSWTKVRSDEERQQTRTRERNGFRIYMKRGWFSSGPDERLGVVLLPSETVGPTPLLNGFVTEWGTDPVWKGAELTERPKVRHLKCLCDESSIVRSAPLRVRVGKGALGSGGDTIAAPYDTELVDLVTLPVELDRAKGLLFADLRIDVGASYMPFVRFGLVRYQANALPGAQLSDPVRTTFCQVLPNRTVSTFRTARREWRVVIAGATVDNSPGRHLSMNASIEVRDGSRTLGWRAVPGAVVELQVVAASDGNGHWEGVVRRPESRGDYRLVVREEQVFGEGAAAQRRCVWVETLRLA
jgi:hypothetical protein